MKNIADHILDIAENSTRAEAEKLEILLSIHTESNIMKLSFVDDGVGMDDDMMQKVRDPFFSTRDTRRIGMGIPLLLQNSEMSGGQVTISSRVGEGTIVVATFEYDDIDCPPLGDVAGAIYFLSASHPDVHIVFDYVCDDVEYKWDTEKVLEAIDGLAINDPSVKDALLDLLKNNITLPR